VAASSFDTFCRFAFTFLEEQGVRYLVIGGLAVVAIGVVRRHRDHLDIAYLETTLQLICELAEDQSPWQRLQRVITDGQ
jgi:hypothetical protein